MPGVYIDMSQHLIIDVDTGKPLATIDHATVEIRHERDIRSSNLYFHDNTGNVKINLELTALSAEFSAGFNAPVNRRLDGPSKEPTKLLGYAPSLLTKD